MKPAVTIPHCGLRFSHVPVAARVDWSWNVLRHLGLIAVCAYIAASVGCDGGTVTAPAPESQRPPSSEPTLITVEFGGRVVDADAGGPVGNVRVSLSSWSGPGNGPIVANDTATSGDGTFTLSLNLPIGWSGAEFQLTAPPGYDDTGAWFGPATAAERRAIRMYPTLVIRPGESIDVRVDRGIVGCGFGGGEYACRRVLVSASPGDPVELELVPDDSSKPMALSPDDWGSNPASRLMMAPGSFPYLIGVGTARLTARR